MSCRGTSLPHEQEVASLLTDVIIFSYWITDDRILEAEICGGNIVEACTRDPYSLKQETNSAVERETYYCQVAFA
jgi:hypothetical protein